VRRLLYPRADAVVVVSTGLARLARESWRVPESRLVHIPNGIDLDRFSPGPSGEFRRQLGVGPEDLLVGSVAHLRPEKNAPRLLDAFLAVAPRHPRAHLVFVGWIPESDDGVEAEYVRRMRDRIRSASLEGRVHFAGRAQDTVPCYRALDLFALASDSEQMPLSLMEAMGCGRAVVSTDVGDAKEMLPEANRPFVTALCDDAAYARALDLLLSDAPLRASLGAENRARALERFGRDRMVADYYRLFGRLAPGASRG
jgi:glycosyltransferase involved in cell wall biosynthesis